MRDNRIKFVLCALCGEPFPLRRNNRRQEYCRNECRLTVLRRASMARATARMQALTRPGDGCWECPGARFDSGYGRVWVGGKGVRAHRFAWELAYGPIPEGLNVLHCCPGGGNRACVRLDHLYLGTDRDNAHDRVRDGRQKGGKPKLTADDKTAIRGQYAAGGITKAALARAYSVSKTAIGRVIGH